ncbi:MAG TPA: GAF domain-containing protein [Terriglobales bacterium]|nr:GAF domain-containing protein [Terriglobales bacterium]
MTPELSSAQRKSILDEGSFQQLLAAAYVVQVHNDRFAARKRKADAGRTLSEIAETQKLIHTQQLDLRAAAKLIAERAQKITNASGVAVGIVEEDHLVYCAATGSAAGEAASRVPLDSSLAANCLRNGHILQCSNAKKDFRLPAELCRERGVKSLIAAPVYHEGRVAGVLELRFARTNSFQEHDVGTSQLMAGLVTEAIVQGAELESRRALAAERASMLDALERIKPQLERLIAEPAAVPAERLAVAAEPAAVPTKEMAAPAEPVVVPTVPGAPVEDVPPVELARVSTGQPPKKEEMRGAICLGCGHQLEEGEHFCGICGATRSGESSGMQSKWASLWHQHQTAGRMGEESSIEESEVAADEPNKTTAPLPPAMQQIVAKFSDNAEKDEVEKEEGESSVDAKVPTSASRTNQEATEPFPSLDEILARFSLADDVTTQGEADAAKEIKVPPGRLPVEMDALSTTGQASVWTSAIKAREWWESLKAQRPGWTEFWYRHRAKIYLGIAAVILQFVILMLVFPGGQTQPAASANSVSSGNAASAVNARRRKSLPQPQLTLFEKLLVSLGLAEPPPAPVYLGNPSTQVWVDLHTALYYCPGSALYGKTQGGKFTTQRDAQQDQFEPANRKACE